MVGALVDLELGGHLAAELALGQHALDGLFENLFRTADEQLAVLLFAQAAGEAGVAAVELLAGLHAGEVDLLGVDHDDVVAHIDVGRVERVGLAGEDARGVRGEAAERLAGGVDHEPLALDVLAAGDRRCLVQVHLGLLLISAVFVERTARLEARRVLQSKRWAARRTQTRCPRKARSRGCG